MNPGLCVKRCKGLLTPLLTLDILVFKIIANFLLQLQAESDETITMTWKCIKEILGKG